MRVTYIGKNDVSTFALWENEIAPKLLDGKNIINLEMATGEPVVYDFNDKLEVQGKTKLN